MAPKLRDRPPKPRFDAARVARRTPRLPVLARMAVLRVQGIPAHYRCCQQQQHRLYSLSLERRTLCGWAGHLGALAAPPRPCASFDVRCVRGPCVCLPRDLWSAHHRRRCLLADDFKPSTIDARRPAEVSVDADQQVTVVHANQQARARRASGRVTLQPCAPCLRACSAATPGPR